MDTILDIWGRVAYAVCDWIGKWRGVPFVVKYYEGGGPWRSRWASARDGQRNDPCEAVIPSAPPPKTVVWKWKHPNQCSPGREAALHDRSLSVRGSIGDSTSSTGHPTRGRLLLIGWFRYATEERVTKCRIAPFDRDSMEPSSDGGHKRR